jgi:hypothetical protein
MDCRPSDDSCFSYGTVQSDSDPKDEAGYMTDATNVTDVMDMTNASNIEGI